MVEPLVVARGLVKRFASRAGDVVALNGVDVTLRPGRITALVGPDGAGKTTLIRLIAGLLAPDAGSVTVDGHDVMTEPDASRSGIGYMPQHFSLYEDLSVLENLQLHADLQDLPDNARAATFKRLLDFTGLGPFTHRFAGKLSGGMKQKLGLACVLIQKPKVLLLDEPTVGVDPISRRDLWQMVQELLDDGIAILWSTGYLDEAERCGDLLLLDQGGLLYAGSPDDFTRRVEGRTWVVRNVPGDRRAVQRRASALSHVADALIQGMDLRLVVAEGAGPPAAGDLGDSAMKLEPEAPRLEDAFVALLSARRDRLPPARLGATGADIPADGPVIEAQDLTRRFGTFVAADKVNFDVVRGEVFGLLGPNGAGKSTTFRMLCGLLPPSSGIARVTGIDLGHAAPAARARIGYVAQKFSLYDDLSGRQNLAFSGGVYGLAGRALRREVDRITEALQLSGYLNQSVAALPVGIKQRLALACAVLHGPAILFLDEPTSGVDPLTRREFWRHINGLAETGVTVMVTTHFLDEAEYCDRIALMHAGRLIALGTPQALKEARRTPELPNPTLEDAFVSLIQADVASAAEGVQ